MEVFSDLLVAEKMANRFRPLRKRFKGARKSTGSDKPKR
jgi:hypothetical protein